MYCMYPLPAQIASSRSQKPANPPHTSSSTAMKQTLSNPHQLKHPSHLISHSIIPHSHINNYYYLSYDDYDFTYSVRATF